MSKDVIVNGIAEKLGVKKVEATNLFDAVFSVLQEEIVKGEVSISKFGKFSVKETAPRTGRNPKTGEAIQIPAGKKLKFSPAKALKDLVNPA